MASTVVKRKGHEEKFSEAKLRGAVLGACGAAHMERKVSMEISKKVVAEIKAWADKKKAVSSDDIFRQTIKALKKHDKNASYMYETHRDIS
ncbi:MAG: hypothetical protein HY364_00220 [Candidatus Aenigmarchaeota archaeon]|nr:hypothetical protein [Candidatus Aenigmarchaeota archaeon]